MTDFFVSIALAVVVVLAALYFEGKFKRLADRVTALEKRCPPAP